ncbi:chitinase [Aspergillus unguis]
MHSSILLLLLAFSALTSAAGVLEVDLVFPQNTTYAPTKELPFVFAIQNAQQAKYLNPRIAYTFRDPADYNTIRGGSFNLHWVNWSNSTLEHEPYYAYSFIDGYWNTSQIWFVTWTFQWDACDAVGWQNWNDDTPEMLYNEYRTAIYFTIGDSGKKVDMVSATANRVSGEETCPEDSGVAIRVTDETMHPPHRVDWYGADATNNTCVVVENTTLTPSPCAVEISSAVAANDCPAEENVAGQMVPYPGQVHPTPYANFDKIKRCRQTLFYDFSLFDEVDQKDKNHKIYACSSYGPDFGLLPEAEIESASSLPNVSQSQPSSQISATAAFAPKNITGEFQIGWWNEGYGLASSGLRSLVKQIRKYVQGGHAQPARVNDKPFILYGQFGQATLGIYIGQGLQSTSLAESLKIFQDNFDRLDVETPSLAMQLCGKGYDAKHIFGVVASSNGTFGAIQEVIRTWNNASCLDSAGGMNFSAPVTFTAPLLQKNQTISHTNSSSTATRNLELHKRAECDTVQIESGNLCGDLATKCGISLTNFQKYNPDINCNNLKVKQHVCCSSGDLPDFSPNPNDDGSCFTYQVKENDNCDNLAAEYSLSRDDLEEFNKNTWGWNMCDPLYKDTIMCLSEGDPPFPAPIANAVCGPQKPGSKAPTDGSDISDMNPCPLNACCNIWGQCGITKDFCVDTNTGAPGTAKEGTYGCISNCGLDVVKGSGSGGIKIGYYEGYGMSRESLFQDALQIDASLYTHLHFGFETLTPEFDVETGDTLSTYEFGEFKKITGAKRILSFGGWAFSTDAATYKIFRDGVTPANRLTMATKIADFIKEHDLDGVDIDWEYPGAPDLPDFDPGTEEEGPNYLAFLVVLKNLLPGKSVSIAAPSSYWYLKQFPIEGISKVVDYIVYMTYDLHGQWDAHNSNSQEGCDTGNCLRSQVNLTETKQSLAMITKAGVPGEKVVVGVTSYGRSFKMAEAGCWGPNCQFTGDRLNSDAKKGVCTGTSGYIADAEIAEILADSSRVTQHFVDTSSNSDILVYDETEWVGYMSASTKKVRTTLYAAWGLGGTSDWATDLQEYHEVPAPATSWHSFYETAAAGGDPKTDMSRNGNWTDFTCVSEYVVKPNDYYPEVRWRELGASAAWDDVVRIWQDNDSKEDRNLEFITSVSNTLMLGNMQNCGQLTGSSCTSVDCPDGANGPFSGPVAQLIWNSLVQIHILHSDYHRALFQVASTVSDSLDDMENTFAPIPQPSDDKWVLFLIDLLTLGTLGAGGPFFNNFLKSLPFFKGRDSSLDNLKDTGMTLVGQGTTIAKDMKPGEKDSLWSAQDQDKFSHYMGNTIDGWANITSFSLSSLFNGSVESVEILGSVMANGKLIEGKCKDGCVKPGDTYATGESDLRANIAKCFFGYAIPALWRESEAYPFIINTGDDCGKAQMDDYLYDKTKEATGGCVNGKQYYLVYPKGDSESCVCLPTSGQRECVNVCSDNKFAAPPGIDALKNFGGITKEELITGSVRTWADNNYENGGGFADPTNQGTIDDLLDVDVTTPGFMRIPVCTAERAFLVWDTAKAGSTSDYPCNVPPGIDTCGESSFENETSDASPDVDDGLQIIKNIQDDASTDWTVQVVGKNQREIAHAGNCAFGAEATSESGNVEFTVGGQDVIDIINTAVEKFGSGGKIGAKGNMGCNGNYKTQPVLWGIYTRD